jgi:hypothetical protein
MRIQPEAIQLHESQSLLAARRRLIDVLLLSFYRFIVRILTLLNVTSGEESVMVPVPPLRKEEFVRL